VTSAHFPLGNFRFFVSLDLVDAYLPPTAPFSGVLPVGVGRFGDVTGLSGELEVLPHSEGGQNDYVHQLPVKHSWSRLILKRGLIQGFSLWDWYRAGLNGTLGARRDGAIILLDPDGLPAVSWTFRAGLAAKWVGPDMSARDGSIAVESVEIAHQGITQVMIGGDPWPM
jgi:phage tail-like protein